MLKRIVLLTFALVLLSVSFTERSFARTNEAVTPFLFPPFFGRSSEESIFDHSSPNYSQGDNRIVLFSGETLNKYCPNPEPVGIRPPNGICDSGYGGYWSYSLGTYVYYNGHDGVDFGLNYRPLLAAADSDQIVYAGWYNPQDHRSNLGIYVRLHHPNDYQTWYGHMSAVAVQSCSTPGCTNIAQGEMIGISGTTGNSSGPHLHFRVTNPQGRAIDPYGWLDDPGADPWPYNQLESLWASLPDISASYYPNVYPSGSALVAPNTPPTGILVDDSDNRFDQLPEGCWMIQYTSSSQSQGGRMLFVKPVSGTETCSARWKLPPGNTPGMYAVYVRIPWVRSTSEGAVYTIFHNNREEKALINQSVFPNASISDGWVYVGKYYFDAASLEYVLLTNRTQDENGTHSSRELGADAVRFVSLVVGTPTNTLTPSLTLTASSTPTPSASFTPSRTTTPSKTFTPTATRTPTHTSTSSRTPTPSRTLRPTDTRWPSNTPSKTKTPTTSNTPTSSRTPTFTSTPTFTRTLTPSRTSTFTRGPSPTRTQTSTRTPSRTPRPSDTRWPSNTPTSSRTPTITRTFTPSRTPTFTRTPTPSRTPTFTHTLTPSRTSTFTRGPSPTRTQTPTRTPSATRFPSITPRPSDTRWPSNTPTSSRTSMFSSTPTFTRTLSSLPTSTFTQGPSPPRTQTTTRTPSATRFPSRTPRPTDTRWPTRTLPPSRTPTITNTPTLSRTPTFTPTPTFTRTLTPSRTSTFTRGPSPTRTQTLTRTPSSTRFPSRTPRPTDTRWPTRTP